MSSNSPGVSVVINSYNGSDWIACAIESVLAQTMEDFELIIVDDCSTDNTTQVVRQFVDPRITLIELPQREPLVAARTVAIERATGEWIAFLDQDDEWLPNKLELQLAAAAQMPDCVMVYCRTERIGHVQAQRNFDPWYALRDLPDGRIFSKLLAHPSFVAMSSLVIRSSVIAELLPMPDHVVLCPDYYLALLAAKRGNAATVQQSCCRYRVHGDSMSAVNAPAIHLEAAKIIENAARPEQGGLARRRRQVGSSLAAAAEFRSGDRMKGIKRLLRDGSILFLAARPFVHAYRSVQLMLRGQR